MGKEKASDQMTHVWFRRRTLPERKGEPCRVLARGRGPGPRNVLGLNCLTCCGVPPPASANWRRVVLFLIAFGLLTGLDARAEPIPPESRPPGRGPSPSRSGRSAGR